MKKILLPFVAVIVCLVTDTASRAVSATTSSPIAVSPPGSVHSRFLVQTGDGVLRTANQARTLTFAERVSYQRAIEDVYWRRRIWPKERCDPKPSLDAVMTQAQLEQKVTDYLRKSQALEDYWHRPITAVQLQAEMDRMATHTKQPEVLHELFEALGNDPFVIAECLARRALAERLLTNWYAYDQRIHGELKQRAEADLQAHLPAGASAKAGNTVEQMKQLSGKYSEIEFVKSDSSHEATDRDPEHAVKLDRREWDQAVQKLAATFNKSGAAKEYEAVPVAKLSSLQEDEDRYYTTAVINKGKDRLRLATVTWQKEPLGSWVANAQNQLPATMAATSVGYALPNVSDGGTCIDDTWTATAGPPDGRYGHTAVWTGSEMIIWGGAYGLFLFRDSGARYDPSTNSWSATSITNAPTGRLGHTAVWTGSEMIIWGGLDGPFHVTNTGGRYNPITDSWIATNTTNAPAVRYLHAAVWTGSEMIIWGGTGANYLNTGGRYNPNTDSWTATSTTNAPSARYGATAVWTGTEMVIWGGTNDLTGFNTGGRYNPNTNSWIATSTTNAPGGGYEHTAIWTGTEMIVWGGYDVDNSQYLNTGGKYNPSSNSWVATSTTNAPTGRGLHTAVWTGSQMIVWGGFDHITISNAGGRYNPGTNSWAATSTTNAPTARASHTAVWTGSEMIVWGGNDDSGDSNIGGRYDPSTNSWRPTTTYNAPKGRASHTAVWTGSEMIVWGGYHGDSYLITGGRYDPTTDTWTATSTTNVPSARAGHTAIWTGTEMIVWGGFFYDNGHHGYQYLNTGGKYNPITNSWIAASTSDAPSARVSHTAVWTGTEMIVWGGTDGFDDLNTGGLYDPATNTWAVVGTTGAPLAREAHTAVWSGNEMIVWGGFNFDSQSNLNTGGRYDPATNSWTATETTNAPEGRSNHTAVWTGSEMIVWGGVPALNTGGRYDPAADSWTATSITNAPDGRFYHTAVWTGSEMIIWGGAYVDPNNFIFVPFNTGGRYNPGADNWTATDLTSAPDARYNHTAVWTGNEMIVWGGSGLNTGGRYCAQPLGGSQLGNISTRAFVQTGDDVVIGGFIVQGNQPKRVIIRAIGPELTQYGVPNALANPTLELHDGAGALIASNDNWTHTIIGGIITSNQFRDIINSGYVPNDERESAIIADLPAGNYTAIVRGVDNVTGVGLVEVYDLSPDSASILGNISSRSFVQTGDNVMIGGFIVQGMVPKRVIVRAIGPELTQYGVPNALANPTLELHDGMGTLIASNDNWQHTIIGGVITRGQVADIQNSGHAPTDPSESAIIAELPPGNYTAIVRGVNSTMGVALVEVYDLH